MDPVAAAAAASQLGWEAWLTAGVLVAMVGALVREVARPGVILLSALGVLLAVGVLAPRQAFSGFSNPAVLTVGALYIVAAGVQHTDALAAVDRLLFSRSRSTRRVLLRFMLPTAGLSAFLNNTPIVAMLIPRLQQWARQRGLSPSKVMIPLSFAAIAGGMTTLIGTSTNLVVSGLMETEGHASLGFFELAWVGLPAAGCILAYFALGGYRLLPEREKPSPAVEEGLQNCLFELQVAAPSPLAGRTVEEAGLRALGDAYLTHMRRDGHLLEATPHELLQPGDVLTFAGSTAALERLLQRPGLERRTPTLQVDGYQTLPLYEAVVAASSDLVGKTLREADFREHYRGVVLAIQRKDEQLEGPLGRTPIRAGDLLLVEAADDFERRWRTNRDEFYLVAPREEGVPARSDKAPIALTILVILIAAIATGLLPAVTAAFLGALAMILTRCLRTKEAGAALNLQVLVVIAAALGLGQAVEETGLASALAGGMLSVAAPLGTVAVLAALYLSTNLLTELITNNAAAVLMLPVALAAAADLGLEPKAVAVLVAIAASASFLTPIGYQTNLMVLAPGGYRYSDYARVGLPLALLVMAAAVAAAYLVWV